MTKRDEIAERLVAYTRMANEYEPRVCTYLPTLFLAKQPRDQKQALSWRRRFSLHRYTVSIGLMQVNADMAPQLQVRQEQLLEPCTNVRVGATILTAVYTQLAREMGEGFSALDVALSFYNTGDSSAGLRNGYVASVYAHAPRRLP